MFANITLINYTDHKIIIRVGDAEQVGGAEQVEVRPRKALAVRDGFFCGGETTVAFQALNSKGEEDLRVYAYGSLLRDTGSKKLEFNYHFQPDVAMPSDVAMPCAILLGSQTAVSDQVDGTMLGSQRYRRSAAKSPTKS